MRIAVFGNKYQKEERIKKIFNILIQNKVELVIQKAFHTYLQENFKLNYPFCGLIEDPNFDTDLALSIGGDGTFLRTAAFVGKKNIPIVGINAGRLGFLADIHDNDIEKTLLDILSQTYRIEERVQLQLTTEHYDFNGFNYALNEIAILKQDTASMLTIHAHINGEYLTSYQADGLVIASPTGSTAYAMSVGGPILAPDTANIVLAAVAPHTLNSRPLVVSDDNIITLEIESRTNNYLVSLDGRSNVLSTDVKLTIQKADFKLKVVKRLGQTFYDTLREKLMWGADSRLKK